MTGPRDGRRFVGPGNHFELVDHVGSGGFGDVWRARDGMLGREVALKFLALDRLAGPRPAPGRVPHIRERFARLYDCAMGSETPFLVMEYVDGEPLNAHVGVTPLPLARTCRWSSQIAQGLAAAHDQSVVHRDIKPGNVLVREADSDVRIVDFGLSHFVDATETRSAAGTPLYMSPEPEHRPHNARADVRVIKEIEQDLDASGPERRADGPSQGPGAPTSDNGFADQLSAAELAVRRLVWKHGQNHALVITARMELADLTGHSGDVRGAAELYDRLGRDCSAWFGPGHSRTLDAFEGMARWVSA